jgi:hypothetical protein
VLPADLSGSVSPTSVSLNAGSSGSANLSVTASTSTSATSFAFDVNANESGVANGATGHGTLTLLVDSAPPSVSIASPTTGATLTGGRVTLAATASDDVAVARVEFYDGTRLLGSDTSAPYSVNWNLRKTTKGTHTIRARAVDTAGKASEASVVVTVQ